MHAISQSRTSTLVGLLMLVTGCPGPGPDARELAEGCLVNTDCREPLVCAFRRCHNACKTDRDCPRGLHCRSADKPLNVCMLDDELLCPGGRDRECPAEMVCGPDLVCRDACRTDRDCLADQSCVQGVCANPAEVVDGGLPINPQGVVRCVLNSDCSSPLVCRTGGCVRECRENRDCALGAFCADAGVCAVADSTTIATLTPERMDAGGLTTGYGEPCVVNSDCRNTALRCLSGRCGVECFEARDCNAGLSQCCTPLNRCASGPACIPPDAGLFDPPTPDGGCRNDADCQDTVRCNGAERCIDRRCRAAEETLCDDGNPCSLDRCSEVGPPCSYTSVVTDADGDGRIPVACGGSADDCDDDDANTFPGAPERCDFKDNNCNGAVDEALWRVKPGTRGPLTAGGAYPSGAGRPSAVMHKGQIVVVGSSDTVHGSLDAFTVDPSTLSLSSGPLPLGGSRTQWTRCGAILGRRIAFPTLASNGVSLMATGYAQSWQGSTCCSPGTPDERDGFYTLFEVPLAVVDGGLLYRTTGPSFCASSEAPLQINNYGIPPSVTADSESGDWLLAWADSTQTGQVLPARVFAATLTAKGGVLSVPRHVWPTGSAEPPALAVGTAGELEDIRSAMAARRGDDTLVAWLDVGSTTLGRNPTIRYQFYDARLAVLRGIPRNLPGSGFNWAIAAIEPLREGFLVVAHPSSGVNSVDLFWLTRDAGVRESRSIRVSQALVPSVGVSAGLQPAIALASGGGVLVAATDYGAVPNSSSLRFLWTNLRWDGGVQSLTLPLNQTVAQHSDFALVSVTPRLAAAFWQDGDIQKVALECIDP